MIHVCSLSCLHQTVAASGARHIVTLLKQTDRVVRPAVVPAENHLILGFDDIAEPMAGYVHPADEHVEQLLRFVRDWNRAGPIVVHCFAGISRSTAGAFVAACALNPQRAEIEIARQLRRASQTASPNRRIVSIADRMLGRSGRMEEAIESIGLGVPAAEGEPFQIALE